MNIAVFVSGNGTNLQRLIDLADSGELKNVKIKMVIADRDCFAIKRANACKISNTWFSYGKFSSELLSNMLLENGIDLIVLAGYLSILGSDFCEKWKGKIINIHPSLLPKFGGKGMYGMKIHKAVLQAGETESGATVHFVTSKIDEGKIILQKSVKIAENETPETLAEKVHLIEYEILPKALEILKEKFEI